MFSEHGPAHVWGSISEFITSQLSCELEEGWGRRGENSGDPIYFCSPGKEMMQLHTVTLSTAAAPPVHTWVELCTETVLPLLWVWGFLVWVFGLNW